MQANGYREPYGVRPVVNFERELDQMAQHFRAVSNPMVQEDVGGDPYEVIVTVTETLTHYVYEKRTAIPPLRRRHHHGRRSF